MESQRKRFGGRAELGLLAVALVTLVAGLAIEARADQRRSADEVEQGFRDRIHLASTFVEEHLAELRDRQADYAHVGLSGDVSADQFDRAASAFGFEAAVLLDQDGTALAVTPQKDGIVGTDLASEYAHLARAVSGVDAVSDVVPSAAEGAPIVAVAVPFQTDSGRRVISGGYRLGQTPLVAFLEATSSLPGRELYLLDGAGRVIASTRSDDGQPAAELAATPAGGGTVTYGGAERFAVAAPVAGTTWRLVAAVPTAELLLPAQSVGRTLWALVAAAAAMAVAVLFLLSRLSRQRDHLRRVSRTDALTGLPNRRRAEEVMARISASSARTGRPWAVAMIDVDRFKAVNERLGHAGGDRVLRGVAAVLADETRASDLCARWGGEEFVIIMDEADRAAAMVASERICAAVRNRAGEAGMQVTISMGVASGFGEDVDGLIRRSDMALYEAKAGGRDKVVAAPGGAIALPMRVEALTVNVA